MILFYLVLNLDTFFKKIDFLEKFIPSFFFEHDRMKVQAHISSGTDRFDKSSVVMTFLNKSGVKWILCSFRLVLEGKAGKVIPESSRFEFLEKFLANNFALSEESNTSGSLDGGGVTDSPLLRAALPTGQKLREPNSREVLG